MAHVQICRSNAKYCCWPRIRSKVPHGGRGHDIQLTYCHDIRAMMGACTDMR